jgi:hypothetical protein
MKKRLSVSLVACFAASVAQAQVPPLPQLVCQRLPTDACGGTGSGQGTTVPTVLQPQAFGRATLAYTPPFNDGINFVSFSYSIPNMAKMVWGGTCGKLPTRDIAVIVSNSDLYSTLTSRTTIPRNTYVSASYMSYSTTNPLSKSLSNSIETAASPNTYWTLVVQEGRWGVHGEDPATTWVRNSAVCKLYMPEPAIYVPPTTYQ